jgi:hypothetical protein
MHCYRVLTSCALLILATSCVEKSPPKQPPLEVNVPELCRELHSAAPHNWSESLEPVIAVGPKAEPFLIAELRRQPAAAGAQASIAALSRLGGAAAAEYCQSLVLERAPLATEAALALGEMKASGSDQILLDCMLNRHADPALRTAAACSLARHGEKAKSPAFLAAIVRAGSPAGRADEQAFGLPSKTRWARERYFVQRTLKSLGHTDLCESLDTDAPWPKLEALAPQIEARLAGR